MKTNYLTRRSLWACLLLFFAAPMLAQHKVTMTTKLKVGATLDKDDFWVNENINDAEYTIDGLTKISSSRHRIDKQTIVITGNIQTLTCGDISLTSLDVTEAPELLELDCRGNELTSIDVKNNSKLTYLACGQKNLKSIDVSNLTNLKLLNCARSPITQLELKNNTSLRSLYAHDCKIKNLDLSGVPALEVIYCNDNELTALDLSKAPKLETIVCGNNKIASLDLTKNDNLKILSCSGNNLSSLRISDKAMQIEGLNIFGNNLNGDQMEEFIYSLPMQQGRRTKLSIINTLDPNEKNVCNVLHVSLLTLKGWSTWDFKGGYDEEEYAGSPDDTPFILIQAFEFPTTGVDLQYKGNGKIHKLGFAEAADKTTTLTHKYAFLAGDIKEFKISGAVLGSLNFGQCTSLEKLDCSDSGLVELDLQSCTSLKELNCSHNDLLTLDVTMAPELDKLNCGHNKLTELDLSLNPLLRELRYQHNDIKTIDISTLKLLRHLENYGNGISIEDMTTLVDQLPINQTEAQYQFCPIQKGGNNKFTNELYEKALKKGWLAMAADENEKQVPYPTSIEAIDSQNLWVQYEPSTKRIVVQGGVAYQPIHIFSMSGTLLAQGSLDANGSWTKDLQLQDSTNILIKVGNQLTKLQTL